MAALSLSPELQVDLAARSFGYLNTPPYAVNDQMSLVAASPGYQATNCRFIREAGILILEPQPLLVPTESGDWAFNSGSGQTTMTQLTDSETGQLAIGLPDATADQTFDISSTAEQSENAAFYMRIGRGQPSPGATLDSQDAYTIILVGDGVLPNDVSDGSTPFRLVMEWNRPPFLQQAVADGNSWYWAPAFGQNGVVSRQIAKSQDLWNNVARLLPIEWIPIPSQNTLMVILGNGLDTLVFRGKNMVPQVGMNQYGQTGIGYSSAPNVGVCAGNIRFYGKNGAATWQYLPMRFATSGSLTSANIFLPFVYQGNGTLELPNVQTPGGTSCDGEIAAVDSTGTQVAYEVDLTSTADSSGLAPDTPIVTDAQALFPATGSLITYAGGFADLSSLIYDVQEHQRVEVRDCPGSNSQAVTVRTQVGVKLNNASAAMNGFGGIHRSCQYSRNLLVQDQSSGLMLPYTAPATFLTGFTAMDVKARRADPWRLYDILLWDKSWMLERVDMGVTPYGDDWCFLAYMGYLCMQAGILPQFLDPIFLQCQLGANPPNCPHFKLPVGTGQSPRVGFSPNTKYWDALCEIASWVHGVIFFDVYGIFHIVPYYPSVYQAPFKGAFTNAGTSGVPGDSDFLSTIVTSLEAEIDTSDRRTGVGFLGVDPSQNTVQGTYINADDFLGQGWTALTHGFRDPMIVVSNLFVDPAMTAQFAISAFQRVTLPNITTQHQALFLPGLYAFDQFSVTELNIADPRGGYVVDGTIYCTCEEIASHWNALDPQSLRSDIKGRWIYNA